MGVVRRRRERTARAPEGLHPGSALQRRIPTGSVRLHLRDAFVTRAQQSRAPAWRQEGKSLRNGIVGAASGAAWLHVPRTLRTFTTGSLFPEGPMAASRPATALSGPSPCRGDATGDVAPLRSGGRRPCRREVVAGDNGPTGPVTPSAGGDPLRSLLPLTIEPPARQIWHGRARLDACESDCMRGAPGPTMRRDGRLHGRHRIELEKSRGLPSPAP